MPGESFQSRALAVVHISRGCGPIEPLSDVRRIDGASRDIDRPAGVAFSFQISGNSVEPTIASRSRNLLSHDDRGPAGTDEAKEVRPQMPWITGACTFSRNAERLARARAGPEWAVVGPSGEAGSDAPQAAPGEEMALCEASKVIRPDVGYASSVDFAVCDHAEKDGCA